MSQIKQSNNHDYQCLLTKARLSPLYRITCTNRLCLIFKYVKGLRYIPEQFLHFESQRTVVVRRSARLSNNSYTLIIPSVTRDRCQKSTIYISSQLWNVLSDDIINLEYANFRNRVRRNDIFNLLCDKNVVKIINVQLAIHKYCIDCKFCNLSVFLVNRRQT